MDVPCATPTLQLLPSNQPSIVVHRLRLLRAGYLELDMTLIILSYIT